MKNIVLILLSFFAINAFSQSKVIDSSEIALKNNSELRTKLHKTTYDKSDTQRVNILTNLSRELINRGNYEQAQTYADEALKIAPIIGFQRGAYDAYNNIGVSYTRQGDYPKALNSLNTASKIAQQINYKTGLANTQNNLAILYSMQSNFPEALKSNLASLKIREELGDRKSIANSYNNIGKVYTSLGKDKEALKYHTLALKIREALGDKRGLMNSYTNFGNIFSRDSNTTEALKNYFAALKIGQELEDQREIATLYMNIGVAYYYQKNDTKAEEYNFKALQLQKALGNSYGVAQCYINAGNIFLASNNFKESELYLDSAIELSKELGAYDLIINAYKILIIKDTYTENWQNAYQHHQMYILYRDSLFSEDNTEKVMQTQMQYELDKKDLTYQKELALKALQVEYEKKQAAAKSEKEKQQLRYEQQIKEQQINFEYNQKIAKTEVEKKQQTALNKVLSAENNLMTENSKNEKKIRWLMITALLGFTAFGINYYRNYKRQQADNKQITKQAEDLKILMKEVHHRVKNNLQIIVAMLRMQARVVEDKAAIEALVNSENRLQAIAIVHEKLYKSDNYTSVLLKDYLQELMEVLAKQHSNPATAFQFKITDNTNLATALDTAIPIGLIVNELVTNSFKYAFNNVAKGEINIELNKTNNNYQLTIQDNGQGLPGNELPKNPKSLGLRLVHLFTEQLNGTLQYATQNGACFVVTF